MSLLTGYGHHVTFPHSLGMSLTGSPACRPFSQGYYCPGSLHASPPSYTGGCGSSSVYTAIPVSSARETGEHCCPRPGSVLDYCNSSPSVSTLYSTPRGGSTDRDSTPPSYLSGGWIFKTSNSPLSADETDINNPNRNLYPLLSRLSDSHSFVGGGCGSGNEITSFGEYSGMSALLSATAASPVEAGGVMENIDRPIRIRVVKRRVSANRKERRRTHSINGAFSFLRDCIPNVPSDTKLSKIKTLRLATSYIAYLLDALGRDEPASGQVTAFKAELTRKVESREDRKMREAEVGRCSLYSIICSQYEKGFIHSMHSQATNWSMAV